MSALKSYSKIKNTTRRFGLQFDGAFMCGGCMFSRCSFSLSITCTSGELATLQWKKRLPEWSKRRKKMHAENTASESLTGVCCFETQVCCLTMTPGDLFHWRFCTTQHAHFKCHSIHCSQMENICTLLNTM